MQQLRHDRNFPAMPQRYGYIFRPWFTLRRGLTELHKCGLQALG